MQYPKLWWWMLWIHKSNPVFFIFRDNKLRNFYFHFKINFVIDFTESKEGLIQEPTGNSQRNTMNNFARRGPQLPISHNVTNNMEKATENKLEKWKDLLKDFFFLKDVEFP